MWTSSDGRRRVVTMPKGSPKGACRDTVKAAIRATDDGYRPIDRRLTVGAWLDVWLEEHVAGGTRPRRPRTVESYRTVVNVHLRPHLGRTVLSRLTREQVSGALASIAARGAAPGTVRHVHTILRVALNEAVRSDVVRQNVALRVAPPEAAAHVIAPWDAAEINAFLDAIAEDRRYGRLFALLVATGVREGEALGLSWNDVDLTAGTLTVRRQWTRHLVMAPTKSAAGVRTIGLNELSTWALRSQRSQQAADRLRAGAR